MQRIEDRNADIIGSSNLDQKSSSSNSEKDQEHIKKMDEEHVKLLKMLEQERKELKRSNSKSSLLIQDLPQPSEKVEEAKSEKSEESFDMFAVDSDDDGKENMIQKAVAEGIQMQADDINIDADGYYQPKVGEIIDGKLPSLTLL